MVGLYLHSPTRHYGMVIVQVTASAVSWSECLATDSEARVRFPALPDFPEKKKGKQVVGLERGPLSLVSTIEELLDKKSSGSCLENREYGRMDPSR
jgi:hypothetical protein